jgi:para-nitrobenzyl esterase
MTQRAIKMNTMRLMLALVVVAITLSIATGQNSGELAGTSWQLVKLQAADESTHVPNDRSKYTITFGRNGRVTARVDCNRASSTWRSPRAGELQFGSWSRTSAKCGPASLHDKIVMEGANVRSYVIKDGHLFLSGMAAGGSYELEPLTTPKR